MLSSRSALCTRCVHRLVSSAQPARRLRPASPSASIAALLLLPRTASTPFSTTATRHYVATCRLSSAFAPPTPQSLGAPRPARTYKRLRKWTRRLVYLSLLAGGIYTLDRTLYASALTRCLRTFSLGILVAADYKINFRPDPPFAASLEAVHVRNAQRLFDLLRTNGGLYLKIGQAIAMQSAVLPPEFQKMFARMFDDAPQNDWSDVERVVREDFGKSVEEVFGVSFSGEEGRGVMERKARASASVAQVHWARLSDGREVAIKIQKREIEMQVGWDLWAFK
jgi:aarF domain-containing kinase